MKTESFETFYEYLYSQRLEWTGHRIPIRFKLDGFLIEGYVEKVKGLKEADPELTVYPAFTSNDFLPSYKVTREDIYPTSRSIYSLSSENEFVISKYITKSREFEIDLNIPSWKIVSFLAKYPNTSFSLEELKSAVNAEIPTFIQNRYLDFTYTTYCLVSGGKKDKFSLVNMNPYIISTSIEQLYSRMGSCNLCDLATTREEVVMSHPLSLKKDSLEYMIIGEAPGVQEEENVTPFYHEAPAGSVLHKVLAAAKIDNFYFTNAVLCRPPGTGNTQNGKPKDEHIKACNFRLKNELILLNPKKVILLGERAYYAYTGQEPPGGVTPNLGLVDNTLGKRKVYLFYHPSYIARQLDLHKSDPEKINQIKTEYLNMFLSTI